MSQTFSISAETLSMSQPKFAVVLAGCGVYDGAEIHESVLTMLAIHNNDATYQCFAPDVDQMHVINHVAGEPTEETRNVLIESARIARGDIKPLSEYKATDFDGIVFPGGFGVAKNLCTFAVDGPDCSVNADVEKAIKDTYMAQKPITALCIAPALVAKILDGVTVTIGNNEGVAGGIETMGGTHVVKDHGEVVVDEAKKVVTTPCYMLDANIGQIAAGADAAIKATLDLLPKKVSWI